MRLYIKLLSLMLLAVSVQKFVFSTEPSSQLWFGLRCEFAYLINDERLIDALVQEASQIEAATPVIVNASS